MSEVYFYDNRKEYEIFYSEELNRIKFYDDGVYKAVNTIEAQNLQVEIKKLKTENKKLKDVIKYIMGLRSISYMVKTQIKEKYNALLP